MLNLIEKVAGCSQLQQATGAHVQIVHHSGWAEMERLRGSSVLHGALDTEILCTRDGSRLTIECKKQKDGPDFPEMAFETLAIGESLVLKPVALHEGKLVGNRALGLRALFDSGSPLSYSAWMKASGLENKASSFKKCRTWLLDRGYAKAVAGGKYDITDAGRLAWNEQGPQGPPKAIGVNGPKGVVGLPPRGICNTPGGPTPGPISLLNSDAGEAA
jgi:hypothetical protein